MILIAHDGKVIARDFMTQYPTGEPAWKPGCLVPDGSVVGLQWSGNVNDLVGFCSWMEGSYGPEGVTLVIPFLPCSRQDKVGPEDGDQSEGVNFIIQTVMNTSGVLKIVVLDNHSSHPVRHWESKEDLPAKTMENIQSRSVVKAEDFEGIDLIVSPDKGALQRSLMWAAQMDVDCLCFEKVRDQASGKIISFSLPETPDISPKRILVVDDILDGGRTFQKIAVELETRWPDSERELFVTHSPMGMLDKNGYPPCLDFYWRVTTTDSCLNAEVCDRLLRELGGGETGFRVLPVLERMTIERSIRA